MTENKKTFDDYCFHNDLSMIRSEAGFMMTFLGSFTIYLLNGVVKIITDSDLSISK